MKMIYNLTTMCRRIMTSLSNTFTVFDLCVHILEMYKYFCTKKITFFFIYE